MINNKIMALVHKHMDSPEAYHKDISPEAYHKDISDFFHKDFFKDEGWYEFSHKRKMKNHFISDSDVDDMKKKLEKEKIKLPSTSIRVDGGWLLTYSLLGEYVPKKKKIIIYEKNIECCAKKGGEIDGDKKHKYVLMTYIHEFSHAFFHHKSGDKYKYVPEIEEAMAELFTLICLDLKVNKDKKCKGLHDFALKNIKKKKKEIGILAAYGFGAYLYEKLEDEGSRLSIIHKFILNIGKIDENDLRVKDYKKQVCFPNGCGYDDSFSLLKEILNFHTK